ncbi:MAG: DUF362 domain-containing protein [Acidobacteria bacterium]|nr:DUF362 domain-containing protein [Acidobacteriota bacterium]
MKRRRTDAGLPNRRDAIAQIARTGVAVAASVAAGVWLRNRAPSGPPPGRRLRRYSLSVDPTRPAMAIVHGNGARAEHLVEAAIGELGGMARFIQPGDIVLVKPNVGFDRSPLLGATTDPYVVSAIVRLSIGAGASRVLVADNPINSPEGAFEKTGIKRAAEIAGAVVMYPRASAFESVAIDGVVLRDWPVFYTPLAAATKVIGVAPTKDHNLCGASMTLKNWYGLLGGARNRLHQKIHEVIADLASMIRPTLAVLDATRVLMTNGPTGGSLSDVMAGNTIVAGIDPVAVDAYGYTLLGRGSTELPYLRLAEERGLGRRDWKSMSYRELTI